MWDMASTLRPANERCSVLGDNDRIGTKCDRKWTWFDSNIVFEFEYEMSGVCRDNLPGHFTGHIYWSAAVHSCSSSDSCETSLSSLLPASASAERHRVT